MPLFHEIVGEKSRLPEWPYPILYEKEQEIETDILVIGGGMAGCWAAISAARKGLKVAMVEKTATVRSGAVGPGADGADPLDLLVPMARQAQNDQQPAQTADHDC